MDLFVYKGLSNLPSIDFDCLRTMAYIKMKLPNVPTKCIGDSNPWRSPNGCLPYLNVSTPHDDGQSITIAGYENIVHHFNQNADFYQIEPDDPASYAYMQYLQNNLHDCLQYYLWGDPQQSENTRMMYAKRTPLFFNFYYPSRYIKRTENLLKLTQGFSIEDKIENHNVENMLLDAKKCLNVLESRLKTGGGFLNGHHFEEVDATLYAYIATVTRMLAPTNALRSHLQECPKLMEFQQKIQTAFLSRDAVETYVTPEQEINLGPPAGSGSTGLSDVDDDKFFAKKMPVILSCLIAAGAMLLFAKKQRIFDMSDDSYLLHTGYADDDDDDDDDDN